MTKRKILVTTGTRAEYGILKPLLTEFKKSSKIDFILVVCGTHLSKTHGNTINEIKNDGFKIDATVKTLSNKLDNYNLTKAFGRGVIQFAEVFSKFKPDINFIMGDRDEMLMSAIAGSHMNIINAHLAGGDKSGGIDEYNRHAITKLSNIHFANTNKSKSRILKMGENPKFVFNTGSPAIDDIKENTSSKFTLEKKLKIKLNGDEIILIQHPITTQLELVEKQISNTVKAIENLKQTTIFIAPNSDAKSDIILKKLKESSQKHDFIKFYVNLPRCDFLGLLKNCGVLVGNSSSGIVEASCFSIPVVNIGIRQLGRERGKNVIEVPYFNNKKIEHAIKDSLKKKNEHKILSTSVYGNRKSSKKIVQLLESINLNTKLYEKQINY